MQPTVHPPVCFFGDFGLYTGAFGEGTIKTRERACCGGGTTGT